MTSTRPADPFTYLVFGGLLWALGLVLAAVGRDQDKMALVVVSLVLAMIGFGVGLVGVVAYGTLLALANRDWRNGRD